MDFVSYRVLLNHQKMFLLFSQTSHHKSSIKTLE